MRPSKERPQQPLASLGDIEDIFCFMAGKVKNQNSDAVLKYEPARRGEMPTAPALPTSSA